MGIAIGIDLGTTNSAAAVYRRGRTESILIEGRRVMPSVISFRDRDQMLVGNKAKARLYIDPEHSVASSKRYIGDSSKTYSIYGRELTPVDVAAEILKKIKEEAGKHLGGEVTEAVITIPAYFTDEQREATKKAGEMAGLRVLRLLPEPTAAAVAYGLDKERNQTIMVYDLGGGTFDVSILKLEGNHFRVLAVDGDSMLGGDDFDNKVVAYVLEKYNLAARAQKGVQGSVLQQKIKETAEQAKIELSNTDIAEITIPDAGDVHIDEELDIETYNQLIQPLLDATVVKLEEVLRSSGLTVRDISRVILVGGSTRNRAIRELIAKKVKQPYIADNVDEIVAHGAAIVAASLSAPDMDNTPIEVLDVTSHSLGINLWTEDERGNSYVKIHHLISKNTTLPCKGGIVGQTNYPLQPSVNMGVYRTESTELIEEARIGELVLPVRIRPYPVQVVALFELDENGILTFSSAEVDKEAPLVDRYIHTGEFDLALLQQMIAQGQIRPQKIVIDTK